MIVNDVVIVRIAVTVAVNAAPSVVLVGRRL